ncbi:cysteine dioxygenase family protein [Actinokineospora sp. UTMC 2448]|uniref:cysteine dioxygenase family protein n=1 Tax=Actinokineospora sp. UTMC 2448 TaxID=2268449 RepID=UPI002164717A|nr:cysteine dioxygenase family protein [Actinokineospora sp. UTMC 2448]UVS79560.1 putative metal-dependent enzyme of the double-stranded beta helix superfamily protein [Actinokineospora sp. UTMC 2448]
MTNRQLDVLVKEIKRVTSRLTSVPDTADSVAEVLRANLPTSDLLTEEQLRGDPDTYTQHVLHAEPDGLFSIVALVWRPGQRTPIHDHLCWCVVGVVEGAESEVVYRLVEDESGQALKPVASTRNARGDVCAFAPPGDIHEVRNIGAETAVSVHVYGADISRVGSSVRRRYALPVLAS